MLYKRQLNVKPYRLPTILLVFIKVEDLVFASSDEIYDVKKWRFNQMR